MRLKYFMIIALDFDGVADKKQIQALARKFVKGRNEVWIVTMRRDNEYNRNILSPVLNSIGLTHHNVIYTDEKPKYEFLQMINADLYIDNESNEFGTILNHTNTIPVLFHD